MEAHVFKYSHSHTDQCFILQYEGHNFFLGETHACCFSQTQKLPDTHPPK